MPTQPGCYGARNLVAIRASLLNSDGTRICPNQDGSAYNLAPVRINVRRDVETGETDVLRNGDGVICSTRTTPDTVTGITAELELCTFDMELIEILTSARLLTAGAVTIGIEEAAPDTTVQPVEFHGWMRAWDGASQAAAPYSYIHFVLFNTTWRLGDFDATSGALTIPIVGKGSANTSISIGSFDDIPPDAVGDGFSAWWFDNDLPDSGVSPYSEHARTCGYVDTPACTSS
jgi:hypothetical protein